MNGEALSEKMKSPKWKINLEVIQIHRNEKYEIAVNSERTQHMPHRSFRKREMRNDI